MATFWTSWVQEHHFLFHSYVGAVWAQDGANAVLPWFCQLVHPWIDPYHSIQVSLTTVPSHPSDINSETSHDNHSSIPINGDSYADLYVRSSTEFLQDQLSIPSSSSSSSSSSLDSALVDQNNPSIDRMGNEITELPAPLHHDFSPSDKFQLFMLLWINPVKSLQQLCIKNNASLTESATPDNGQWMVFYFSEFHSFCI